MAGDDNLFKGLVEQAKDVIVDAYDAHPARFAIGSGVVFAILLWVIY